MGPCYCASFPMIYPALTLPQPIASSHASYDDPGKDLFEWLVTQREEINQKKAEFVEQAKVEKTKRVADPDYSYTASPIKEKNEGWGERDESPHSRKRKRSADVAEPDDTDSEIKCWLEKIDKTAGRKDKFIRFADYVTAVHAEKIYDLLTLKALGRVGMKAIGIQLGPAIKIEKWLQEDCKEID